MAMPNYIGDYGDPYGYTTTSSCTIANSASMAQQQQRAIAETMYFNPRTMNYEHCFTEKKEDPRVWARQLDEENRKREMLEGKLLAYENRVCDAPARTSKIEHETTLERLWRKTNSWLSTPNTNLALQ